MSDKNNTLKAQTEAKIAAGRKGNPDFMKGVDETIAQAKAENKSIDQVGVRFMRFCGKYDLNRINEQAQIYVEPFNARLLS